MFISCYWFFITDYNLDTKAYYEDSNGNIQSSNLADLSTLSTLQAINSYNYSVNEQVLTISQYVSDNDPYVYFNNFITLNAGTYSMYYLVDTQQVQAFGLTQNNTQNFLYNIPYQNYSRFTISSPTTFGLGFEGNGSNGRTFNIKVMIYSENYQMSYQPYGETWYQTQVIDYPDNYFNYIIGNNYFSNASYTFIQRQSNFDGTLKVASSPLYVNNLDIDGNNLNSSSSFNYLFNNAMTVDSNLNQIHVYNDINYSTSNFTYVRYFPHYNLPSNERSGLAMPLKYINMSIDGSNYNGLVRLTCQVVGGNTPSTYQYINIEKDVNNLYVINFPTSDLFLLSIDIQAVYSNGSYNFPTFIQSNVSNVESFTDFDLGYETAKNEYENALHTSEEINRQLQLERDNIFSQYRDLVERYNQALYSDNALSGMILAIVDAPINIFKSIFDFEILGINIIGVVFGIITLLLIIWLIKKLL